MTRNSWAVLLLVITLGACAPQTPEQQVVEDAATALGGRAAVEAVNTLVIEGEGEQGNLGQGATPEVTPTFTISDYKQLLDIPARRRRVEQTRTPNFLYFRGPDPITQNTGVDGDVAYDLAADTSAARAPEATAHNRQLAFHLYPITAVRAALDPGAALSSARTADGESMVDIITTDGLELTLAIDASTKLPTSVSSMNNHANLRDVTLTARFRDYEDVDGLMLPTGMTVFIDEIQLTDLRFTSNTVDGDVGDLSAPASASDADPITGPPPAVVTAEELADGVWFLAGQSHHSVLIELDDHTMLIEAPNEVRTLAVIAKSRELVPDKPLTHLVSTHHHFDHSGGVRAAIAEGLTIVTQAANAPFYEALAKRPSTIVADALAQNPQPAIIEPVEDHATHGDGTMTVELYHIAGNPHGDALLMAYVPQHRLLIEVDAFSPSGRDYHPYAANLLENIQARNLRVERIVPLHSAISSYDELVSTVASMTD